jgi:hypothetical protein
MPYTTGWSIELRAAEDYKWFALGFLEVLACGKIGVTPREITLGKLTTR